MAFIFPNSWDDDPIRLAYFSGGWLNHHDAKTWFPEATRSSMEVVLLMRKHPWPSIASQRWDPKRLMDAFHILIR